VRNTPRMKYVVGGVLAGAIFVLVSVLWNAAKVALDIPPPEGQPPFSILRTLIWSMLPGVTTIAITRLARLPHWPAATLTSKLDWLYVRVMDGAVVSLAFFAGWALAFPLHDLLGLELATALQTARDKSWVGVPVFWTLQLMSFMIGFLVVKDVRAASHATITAPLADHSNPAPGPSRPILLELVKDTDRKAAA